MFGSKDKALRRTTALGAIFAGVAAIASPAAAQEQAPPPPAQEATPEEAAGDEEEAIVVVGSRIRRDAYNTASPVQLITRDESTLAGFNTTTDILQGTATTGGAAQINNAFGGFVTDGGPGANTLGLRGLGATRTLILLNGRRLAPAGTRGAVGSADLNVLPNAMVDHIEILKDGASSIYGSDAVAGVVNIITQRGIDGWTLEGQYDWTPDGGGEETRVSLVSGYTGDRFEFSGSFDWYTRQSLALKDRDWTQCQTDYLVFLDGTRGDDIDPATGEPKCYTITGTGSGGVTINTIGTSLITGDEFVNLVAGVPLLPGVVHAPGVPADAIFNGIAYNRWRPNVNATTGLIGFEGVGGVFLDDRDNPTAFVPTSLNIRDTFEPRMLNEDIISPADVYTVYLQGSYDLSTGAELYGEFLYSRRESQQTGYRQLVVDYPKNSPLIPSNLAGSTFSGAPLAPGTFPVGIRLFMGFGNDFSHQEVDFFRTVFGVRGDFFVPGWKYDVGATISSSNADYTFQAALIDRLFSSLQVVPAPDGFDPGVRGPSLVRDGLMCAVTATNPAFGCIPAPPLTPALIGGEMPGDWRNWFWQDIKGNTQYDEDVVTAIIDGPLFDLPGGEVQVALGVEYRTAEIDDSPDENMVSGNLFNFTTATPTRGTDSVWEAFAEAELPLLANIPGIHALTLNLSGRYTDYDSYGSDETYKVGGIYSPVRWLSFRGSFGTSFRAPALFEQFQGDTTGFLSQQTDPCNEYGALDPSTPRFINCDAELNNPSFVATSGIRVVTNGGADAGLAAETSENTTYGVVLQPPLPDWFGDLSVAVDYYNIEVVDQVAQIGAGNILDRCYDDPQFRAGGGFCNLVAPRASGSNALTVFDSYINIATQIVEGYDYNLRYIREFSFGTFRLNALVTQYLSQSSKLFEEDPLDEFNATLNNPEYTAVVDATWTQGSWRFRYGVEWLSAMDSYELVFGEEGIGRADVEPFVFDVDDYYLHHVSVQYTNEGNWQATFGVRNLLDEEPPQISFGAYNRVGNAPLYSGYDYIGRQFFVNLVKEF